MGRNVYCSSQEPRIAKGLRRSGKSLREIAKLTVHYVQNDLKVHNKKEVGRRPSTTQTELDRRIIRIAKSNPFKSSIPFHPKWIILLTILELGGDYKWPNYQILSTKRVPLMRTKNLSIRQNFAKDHITRAGSEYQKKLPISYLATKSKVVFWK